MIFLIELSSILFMVAVHADTAVFCDPRKHLEFTVCKDICPVTCGNIHLQPLPCTPLCITPGGCKCKSGYVRDFEGNCIEPKHCSASCNEDPKMEWNICGDRCPKFCGADDIRRCPRICGPPACACKRDFVRSITGACITKEECGGCRGDFNAVVDPCGDFCPTTCENINNPPYGCPDICIPDGCKCKPGFVLNEAIGRCVAPENCPSIVRLSEGNTGLMYYSYI